MNLRPFPPRIWRLERKDARLTAARPASVLIGESAAMRYAVAEAMAVAGVDTSVLLMGETGTGKEVVARTIWERGARRHRPFVAVNCAALPDALVESELFGYEKGAFTGALARTPGKFEIAHTGTLLLDEVGDLPLPAQAKLLRVLQEREVQRVGGGAPMAIDVRVIAATNQNLASNVRRGTFREDLYYRLAVFPICLPPLRDRREDIPPLARHFVATSAGRIGAPESELTQDAVAALVAHDWPGNVRELQNVIERAVLRARGGSIEAVLIQFDAPLAAQGQMSEALESAHVRLSDNEVVSFAEAERRAIVSALEQSGWRISGDCGAATLLDLKPTTLHAKMKRLGIRRPSPADATEAEALIHQRFHQRAVSSHPWNPSAF
jgi:transcriptional regulator with GAF, ATPase, and Fis domain